MKPITVLIPVHGEPVYLRECLESITFQDHSLFTLLIVDDNCKWDLVSHCKDFFSQDMYEIVRSKGTGIVDALNTGLDIVKTNLIARIDCDDLMAPDRLHVQYQEFLNNEKLVLLGSSIMLIESDRSLKYVDVYPKNHEKIIREITRRNPFAHPSVMFKTEAAISVGRYRKFYQFSEDFDLWLRLSEIGEVANLQECLTSYRIHEEQISKIKSEKAQLAYMAALTSYRLRKLGLPDLSQTFVDVEAWEVQREIHQKNTMNLTFVLEYLENWRISTMLKGRRDNLQKYILSLFVFFALNPMKFIRASVIKLENNKAKLLFSIRGNIQKKLDRQAIKMGFRYRTLQVIYGITSPRWLVLKSTKFIYKKIARKP